MDSAAASAPPATVIDAMVSYLEKTKTIGPYFQPFRKETYALIQEIRVKTAHFLGAQQDEISFTKNGSEGISIVAQGIDWKPGDEVIISDNEMLSNLIPWLQLQKMRGIKVVTVPTDEETLIQPETLASLMTDKTRLVSVTHLSNSTGAVQPLQALCDVTKKGGALFLVDACQSFGLIPIDVSLLGCDFLVACGRKAMRGPEGSSVLFVRHSLRASITPCLVGWWNCDYDAATGSFALHTDGTRFEAGCPITPAIIGLGAAIDFAESLGIENIYHYVQQLTAYAVEQLESLPGIQLYGPKPHNRLMAITFNLDGVDPDLIAARLMDNNIVIESGTFNAFSILKRYGIKKMARTSPLYFNTQAQINAMVAVIRGCA